VRDNPHTDLEECLYEADLGPKPIKRQEDVLDTVWLFATLLGVVIALCVIGGGIAGYLVRACID